MSREEHLIMDEGSGDLIGSIAVADLAALCELEGRELPYPFAPTRNYTADESEASCETELLERIQSGDLNFFRAWMSAYVDADIWVECRVHYGREQIPDTRIMACRVSGLGFVASQRAQADVIDIYELSAYELGTAIAGLVELSSSGSRNRIVIPQYVGYFSKTTPDPEDDYTISVRVPVAGPGVQRVPGADVVALATVQSHSRPARTWGVDWDAKFLVWVQITNDGDYIYDEDFSYLVPLSQAKLGDRIDRLIAEDVVLVRRRRGLG